MNAVPMRRINVHVDVDLDKHLAAEAARRGMSKAALIRELARSALQGSGAEPADPIDALIGAGEGSDVDDIDRALYG